MRVLITGGAGFIGSAVVRKLVERGQTVRCLVRKTSNTSRIDDIPFERVEGDVRDSAPVHRAMAGCDAAVHLACISNWSDVNSSEMDHVVIGGTKNVLDAARSSGCSRVVYISSTLAVCSSRTPQTFDENSPHGSIERLRYSRAKVEAERLCRDAAGPGLCVIIVNPGEVYGPNDHALVTAGNLIDFAKSRPVFVCRGGTAIAYVDDVAEGILAALVRGRSGERYILAGENLSVRQIAEVTLELLGRKRTIILLPNWFVRGLVWLHRMTRIPLPFNPEVALYATQYWFMDSSKAHRELGVQFRNARETLRPTVQWLQEYGYLK